MKKHTSTFRKLPLFVLLFFIPFITKAQLAVTQGTGLSMTPLQLVQQILVGGGVTVSNATFNGSAASISSNLIGSFVASGAAATQLGFGSGIVITSGAGTNAIGPNTSGSSGSTGSSGSDPDLQALIPGYTIYDKAILEFDFVPISDTIKFRYVFGSEEFDEFCNSSFNDVFGFFVSGPGITGPFSNSSVNIALMPGSSQYVTIDNVCACSAACSWLNNGGLYYQYDRLTYIYTAMIVVQPCQQYHLKIAIGDAGDAAYDSGVFLEANSFSSNGITYNTSYSSNIDTMTVEGCNDAIISFLLNQPASDTIVINYFISGTATEGVDFPGVPDSLFIFPGQDSVSFTISPISDGISEPTEIIYIAYVNTVCGSLDTIILLIKDYTPISTTSTPDVFNCNGQQANIGVTASGGYPPFAYNWSSGAGASASVVVNPPTPTTYYVTVSDACNYFTIDSVQVSISNLASAITNVDSITCYGYTDGSATVTASDGIPPYTYIWSPTNDNTATTDSLGSGTYFVTVTDGIGCEVTNFVIIPSPPQVTLTLNPTNESCFYTCNGQIIGTINGAITQPVTYEWNTSPQQQTLDAYSLCPGDYTITVTYSPYDCKIIQTANISTNTIIDASFTSNPSPPEGYVPFEVFFTNTSTPGVNCYWDFGDGNSSTDWSPSHTYTSNGVYTVTLTINSGPPDNCQDVYVMTVNAIQPSSLVVPNVFTPNGDGINEQFSIESEGIKSITIMIFNRWGKKMHETSAAPFTESMETKDVWDGTTNGGAKCADGTYFYIIDAEGYDKKIYHLQGTINIIN